MVLYVDETECPEYFIVTGLLVNSKQDVELAFKRFKKSVSKAKIPAPLKSKLFTEFKSVIMDRTYQNMKIKMLSELNEFEHCVVYSAFVKKTKNLSQKDKERAYINLIARIASSLTKPVEIVFDMFNKKTFESEIIKKLKTFKHVISARAADSQRETGIKFVDNLCSTIRLHLSGNDNYNFYGLIENWVIEVI